MKNKFVQTSNVTRFLTGISTVEGRGVPEASWMLVSGDAGYGKSRTGSWWATQNNAVLIRCKAAATPRWMLTDLVRELGEQAPANNCRDLHAQAVGYLAKTPRPIVIDEVEHTMKDLTVLETIRDISDLVEIPVVLFGREYVYGKLKRHNQFLTRITARADFGPATLEDVKKCTTELCEVEVSDDLVKRVLDDSDGHIRNVVKALHAIEKIGRRSGKKVELEDVKNEMLVHSHLPVTKRSKAA